MSSTLWLSCLITSETWIGRLSRLLSRLDNLPIQVYHAGSSKQKWLARKAEQPSSYADGGGISARISKAADKGNLAVWCMRRNGADTIQTSQESRAAKQICRRRRHFCPVSVTVDKVNSGGMVFVEERSGHDATCQSVKSAKSPWGARCPVVVCSAPAEAERRQGRETRQRRRGRNGTQI